MQVQKSQISFTSGINFTTADGFAKEIAGFHPIISVDYPWTVNEIVRTSTAAYTKRIRNCTGGGILVQNPDKSRSVVFFHLDPANTTNQPFQSIQDALINKIGGGKALSGFLLGSKKLFENSTKQFENLEAVIKSLKIPYSKFMGLPINKSVDLGYNVKKDLFIVCASAIPNPQVPADVFNAFDEVKISKNDFLIMG